MKVLGILTDDFAVYYELVQALKERNVPFHSLVAGAPVPADVGVVVTTAREAAAVRFPEVVVFTTPRETIEAAARALAGRRIFQRVVVGIDPGEKPGVAVLADGFVLSTTQVRVPEQVAEEVEKARRGVAAEDFTVRVGHGAPTYRDRILRALQTLPERGLEVRVEVVDETASTPATYRTAEERDTTAAHAIALARGVAAAAVHEIRPSEGELRDIQRKSRLASDGRVTITRRLARAVALGELTLDEAIGRQEDR